MPGPHPRVGVVVLNYRGLPATLGCLASLRALDLPARIVVVDNGSGDGSVERLREEPDVELLTSATNRGFGGGMNLGIDHLLAGGVDYAWVLNNDTTVEPSTLRALVEVAEADLRVGAVGSVLYDAAVPTRVLTWGGGHLSLATGHTRDAVGPADRIDYLTGASLLLRSAALREVGTFDERYFFTWEDVDLCVRLRAAGWRLAVAPSSRVWHENGGTAPPMSPLRVTEHAAGVVTFMREHSRAPRLTSLPLLGHYALEGPPAPRAGNVGRRLVRLAPRLASLIPATPIAAASSAQDRRNRRRTRLERRGWSKRACHRGIHAACLGARLGLP